MPTFAADPTFETPDFNAGMAVAPVGADVRLYSANNIYGATLGAPAPRQAGAWGIGQTAPATAYGIEIATFVGDKHLPITLKPMRACKIQYRSRDRGRAYVSRLLLMEPRTNAIINCGVDQTGLIGLGINWTVPHANDVWVEVVYNVKRDGKITISASKWAAGEAPGTHAPAETLNGSTGALVTYPDDGVLACILDNASSIYKIKYWEGTPDPSPAGLASIPGLVADGWRWSGSPSASMAPTGQKAVTGEVWQRQCVMGRGGTHIGIVLQGFTGNDDTPLPVAFSTSVRVRKNGGAWVELSTVGAPTVVAPGDVAIPTIAFAHVAGDIIDIGGTQTAGTHIPVLSTGGHAPYFPDALGNAQGIAFGVISKVNDSRKSASVYTDSLGQGVASEAAYEAGCGVFNCSLGGAKLAHVAGFSGGLKIQLVPFGDYTVLKLSANDILVDLAASQELFEREAALMNRPEIKGKHVVRWYMPPIVASTQQGLPGSTWTTVKGQPRLHNSPGGPSFSYRQRVGRDVYGLYINGDSIVSDPDSLRVWKANASSDGIHYAEATKTALKNYGRDQMIAWLASLDTSGGGGLTTEQATWLEELHVNVPNTVPTAAEIAAAILANPGNKLATDVTGRVTTSNPGAAPSAADVAAAVIAHAVMQRIAASLGTHGGSETAAGETLTQVMAKPAGGSLRRVSVVSGGARVLTVTEEA